jgi:hypothetical protein
MVLFVFGKDCVVANFSCTLCLKLCQEETQKTLESFLQNFVQTFKDWTPVEHVQAAEILQAADNDGSLHKDSGKTVVGCRQGHPTKVIVGMIRELKAVIQSFTACKFQQHDSNTSERKKL